jgi:hypothetical protein
VGQSCGELAEVDGVVALGRHAEQATAALSYGQLSGRRRGETPNAVETKPVCTLRRLDPVDPL